jgi:hypothetical protein
MAIQTKDDAQSKADRRVDRSFFKTTKQKPLMEMKFSEVISLADQLEWLRLKRIEKDKQYK